MVLIEVLGGAFLTKTFEEINEKLKKGKAVVVTAGEFTAMAKENGVKKCAREVDVVTTATFGAMCSSGAFLNFGHSEPPIRMAKIWLNDVQAYGGLAAVDTYIGATQPSDIKGNEYGGAHVIEDLVAGKKVMLKAESGGTDCYPRLDIKTAISLKTLNQAYLYNPRNCYQNYGAAVNGTKKTLYTYMGVLLSEYGNITYSTAGEYSPLLKDPHLRGIGIGTRIFMGGGEGYITWQGTQAVNNMQEYEDGEKRYAGYTLALTGDLKGMSTEFLRAAVFERYGVSMYMGLGIPVPVLDEDLAADLAMPNERLYTHVFDYGVPSRNRPSLLRVSYAQLRSGEVELNGKKVPTAPLSSLYKAKIIANLLKEKIITGQFVMTVPSAPLPENKVQKPLEICEEV
jgi:uncharacterized protein (DUF39 family)